MRTGFQAAAPKWSAIWRHAPWLPIRQTAPLGISGLCRNQIRDNVSPEQQVSARFPADDLARANVADNAASLAGAEHDYDALDLAIATYEQLLGTAEQQEQKNALETAIRTLKQWRF